MDVISLSASIMVLMSVKRVFQRFQGPKQTVEPICHLQTVPGHEGNGALRHPSQLLKGSKLRKVLLQSFHG